MKLKLFLTLLFLFTYVSCTNNQTPSTGSSFKSIINGSVDTDPSRDAVAFIYNSDGYACGSTLIAPNILLTAAHCATVQGSTTPVSPSKLTALFCRDISDSNECNVTRYREILQVYVYPGYDASNTRYDLAMLRLKAPAPGDVVPIPPLPYSMSLTSSDVGDPIVFAGFGLTDGSDSNSTSSQRRVFTGSIAGICNDSGGCNVGYSYYIAPYTIYTDQSSGGTCQGDSGGPGLVVKNGKTYVAGITSYGFNECTGPGVYTEVSLYEDEINSFINNPPAENCSNGTDDNGDGMADCADPACAGSSSCPSNACEDTHYLLCNTNQKSGNTNQGTGIISSYSCGGTPSETASEYAYMLAMPPGTVAHITLTPIEQNLDMFIVGGDDDSCSADTCQAYSANTGLSDETLDYTVTEQTSYLIIDSPVAPGPYYISVTCDYPPENCSNGIDDDGDNKTDCDDPDCTNDPYCQGNPVETLCSDGQDNDNDGAVDCDDPDCAASADCNSTDVERLCTDGIDNDGDGRIDCADPDCQQTAANCQDDGGGSGNDSGCSVAGNNGGDASFILILLFVTVVFKRFKHFLTC